MLKTCVVGSIIGSWSSPALTAMFVQNPGRCGLHVCGVEPSVQFVHSRDGPEGADPFAVAIPITITTSFLGPRVMVGLVENGGNVKPCGLSVGTLVNGPNGDVDTACATAEFVNHELIPHDCVMMQTYMWYFSSPATLTTPAPQLLILSPLELISLYPSCFLSTGCSCISPHRSPPQPLSHTHFDCDACAAVVAVVGVEHTPFKLQSDALLHGHTIWPEDAIDDGLGNQVIVVWP